MEVQKTLIQRLWDERFSKHLPPTWSLIVVDKLYNHKAVAEARLLDHTICVLDTVYTGVILEDEACEVLAHEVAHALHGFSCREEHSELWRAIAMSLGATGATKCFIMRPDNPFVHLFRQRMKETPDRADEDDFHLEIVYELLQQGCSVDDVETWYKAAFHVK